MTDDDRATVREVRERQLLREFDRATEIRARLIAQLALIEQVRTDLVAQMRLLLAPPAPARPVDGLGGLSRRRLYRLAVTHGIAGRSGMDREQLVDALRAKGVTGDGAEG